MKNYKEIEKEVDCVRNERQEALQFAKDLYASLKKVQTEAENQLNAMHVFSLGRVLSLLGESELSYDKFTYASDDQINKTVIKYDNRVVFFFNCTDYFDEVDEEGLPIDGKWQISRIYDCDTIFRGTDINTTPHQLRSVIYAMQDQLAKINAIMTILQSEEFYEFVQDKIATQKRNEEPIIEQIVNFKNFVNRRLVTKE